MLDSDYAKTATLDFDVTTAAIKGARDYQEDAIIAHFPKGQTAGFAVIADGIGGHAAGDVASTIAVTEVFGTLLRQQAALEAGALNIPLTLRDAVEAANATISAYARDNDEAKGMGSTLLLPVIRGNQLSWLSIGDSPLLLFRDGALRQLNKDHSMAPQIDMMVKMGAMKADVARDHPDRNALTSVLNGEPVAMIDCPAKPTALKAGDILIAASDGVQFLSNALIANTLALTGDASSADTANAILAALAQLDHPDQDNASFAVIKLSDPTGKSQSAAAEDAPVLARADTAPDPQKEPDPAPAEPVKDESKAYWYRGQKYYRD